MRTIQSHRVKKAYYNFILIFISLIIIACIAAFIPIFWEGPVNLRRGALMISVLSFFIALLILVAGRIILDAAGMYYSFIIWKSQKEIEENEYEFDVFKSRKRIELGELILHLPEIQLYKNGYSAFMTFEGFRCGEKGEYQNIKRIYDWKYGDARGLQFQTTDYKTFIIHPYGIDKVMKTLSEKLGEKWKDIYMKKEIPNEKFWLHHDDVPIDWRIKWREYVKGGIT